MSDPETTTMVISALERAVNRLNLVVHQIAMAVLFLMMILTTGDVLGRRLFSPIPGTFELTELGMVILVFFSMGYTQVRKGHVNIDLIVAKFSTRVQALFDAVTYLIMLVLLVLVTWQLFAHANRLLATNNVTGVLGIPLYPIALLGAVGNIIFCLAVVVDLGKSVVKAVQNK